MDGWSLKAIVALLRNVPTTVILILEHAPGSFMILSFFLSFLLIPRILKDGWRNVRPLPPIKKETKKEELKPIVQQIEEVAKPLFNDYIPEDNSGGGQNAIVPPVDSRQNAFVPPVDSRQNAIVPPPRPARPSTAAAVNLAGSAKKERKKERK